MYLCECMCECTNMRFSRAAKNSRVQLAEVLYTYTELEAELCIYFPGFTRLCIYSGEPA